MVAIGGFRSDLSITRKTDGTFGNVSAGFVFQSRVSTKTSIFAGTLVLEKENRNCFLQLCQSHFFAIFRGLSCLISVHSFGRVPDFFIPGLLVTRHSTPEAPLEGRRSEYPSFLP